LRIGVGEGEWFGKFPYIIQSLAALS